MPFTHTTLEAGESAILIFDGKESPFPAKQKLAKVSAPEISWDIFIKECARDTVFREYRRSSKLINISAPDGLPEFSGEILYKGRFEAKAGKTFLDLGELGSTANIRVNGKQFRELVAPPFRTEITDAVKDGVNEIEITVSNTLSNRIYDYFSEYLPLHCTGLFGPVKLITE